MNKEDLLQLKDDIQDAKQKVSEKKGSRSNYYDQLKNQFGCETLDEAKKKLEEMKEQKKKYDEQISEKTKEIEEKYDTESQE